MVRKSLRGKRNDEKFTETFEVINDLTIQADNNEIDFYYFDEPGFNTGTLCIFS